MKEKGHGTPTLLVLRLSALPLPDLLGMRLLLHIQVVGAILRSHPISKHHLRKHCESIRRPSEDLCLSKAWLLIDLLDGRGHPTMEGVAPVLHSGSHGVGLPKDHQVMKKPSTPIKYHKITVKRSQSERTQSREEGTLFRSSKGLWWQANLASKPTLEAFSVPRLMSARFFTVKSTRLISCASLNCTSFTSAGTKILFVLL